jgi:hypothetical protein
VATGIIAVFGVWSLTVISWDAGRHATGRQIAGHIARIDARSFSLIAGRLEDTMMRGNGFLAIWSDVEPDAWTDYLHWLTREHTSERIGTTGFLAVRVFRALDVDAARVFILYELDGPEVLSSADYVSRLNAPTPWSQRIMPALGNFIRGGGRRIASAGVGQGGFIGVLALDEPPQRGTTLAAEIAALDRIAAVRVLETDRAGTAVQTREKAMRSSDRSFGALLIIEALDRDALDEAHATLRRLVPEMKLDPNVPALHCAQIFALDRTLLP